MKKEFNPTDAELEILHVIWQLKEARVKQIHEVLSKAKDVGYTTVLKIMQIMHEKGMLSRIQEGKSHIYKAIIEKEQVQERFLDKVMNSLYEGSAYNLVMSALGNNKTSDNELEKIKQLIIEQQKKIK